MVTSQEVELKEVNKCYIHLMFDHLTPMSRVRVDSVDAQRLCVHDESEHGALHSQRHPGLHRDGQGDHLI